MCERKTQQEDKVPEQKKKEDYSAKKKMNVV